MRRAILIVGARRAALEAVRRRNDRCLLLAEPGAPRSVLALADRAACASFDADEQVTAAAATLLHGDRAAAVIAVTQRAVVPAAVVRESLGLPGSSRTDAAASHSKLLMKARLVEAGVPCVPLRGAGDEEQVATTAEGIGWPIVVKGLTSSGSRQTFVAVDEQQAREAARRILETPGSGGIGVEPWVDAAEVSAEIWVAEGTIGFVNITEYVTPGQANLVPAPLDDATAERVRAVATAAVRAFGLPNGLAHVELFLTEDGPVIGELNARPPGGNLMGLMARVYRFDPWDAVIEASLPAGLPRFSVRPWLFAGNIFFHADRAGTLRAIDGWDAATALPGVVSATLRRRPGQRVGPRRGTGGFHAEIVVEAEDPAAVRDVLMRARDLVSFIVA